MARVLRLANQAGSRIAARLVRGEDGQDRIEHRLLLGIITSGTIALMPTRSTISTANQTWGTGLNNLWVLPASAA
jgi:Flp pilus assembly pilin Flp